MQIQRVRTAIVMAPSPVFVIPNTRTLFLCPRLRCLPPCNCRARRQCAAQEGRRDWSADADGTVCAALSRFLNSKSLAFENLMRHLYKRDSVMKRIILAASLFSSVVAMGYAQPLPFSRGKGRPKTDSALRAKKVEYYGSPAWSASGRLRFTGADVTLPKTKARTRKAGR